MPTKKKKIINKIQSRKTTKRSKYLIITGIIVLLAVITATAFTLKNRQTANVLEIASLPGSCAINFDLNRPSPSPVSSPNQPGTPSPLPASSPSCNTTSSCYASCYGKTKCGSLGGTVIGKGSCQGTNYQCQFCTTSTVCTSPSPVAIASVTPSSLPVLSPSPIATSSSLPASPTPSTAPSVCDIRFSFPDKEECSKTPYTIPITYRVNSLPPGGPYYVVTDWYTAAPIESAHNYFMEPTPLEVGKTYTLNAYWPGRDSTTVEIHAGLQVVPNKYELLEPNCTDGIDYYWTPFTSCP